MKKIKEFFGRFYLEHPKKMANLSVIIMILALACVAVFAIFLFKRDAAIGLVSIVVIISLIILLSLFYFSEDWAKELSEYTIQEAEKRLGEDYDNKEIIFYTHKLKALVEIAKSDKSEEAVINALKEFLGKIDKFYSLKNDLDDFRTKQKKINELISRKTFESEKLVLEISAENEDVL